MRAVEVFGNRVYGVHLKDVKNAETFTILGQGDLRTIDLLKALAANKYGHCLAIEYEEKPENPLEDIKACLAEAKQGHCGHRLGMTPPSSGSVVPEFSHPGIRPPGIAIPESSIRISWNRPTHDPPRARTGGDGYPRRGPSVRRDGPFRGQRPFRGRFSGSPWLVSRGRDPRRGHRHGADPRSRWPRADPKARILALDLAENMLARAAENIAEAGLEGRIRCLRGDVKGLAPTLGGHNSRR